MFSNILEEAINCIESVKLHYETTSPCISAFSEESMEKNVIGFALKTFMKVNAQPIEDENVVELKKRIRTILDKHIDIVEISNESTNKVISYIPKNVTEDFFLNVEEQYYNFIKASKIIAMNADHTLIMLIIQYEKFISSIFEKLIYKFPDKYLSEKSITYSEIIGSDIERIKEVMINREIESIMRKEFTQWFKMLEEHKVSFNIDAETMRDLKEAYYRRNIVVHNDAKVNSIYQNAMKGSQYANFDIGTQLHANSDEAYLPHLFDLFTIIIYAITFGLLKLSSNCPEECNRIFDAGFRHMLRKEWSISEYVFRFLKDNKQADALTRTMALVNYWISIKNIDGFEAIEGEVTKCDFSAADIKFVLAQKVLLNKYDDVTEMIEKLLQQDIITVNELETWPLFEDYRNSEQFERYREMHLEQFRLKKYENDVSSDYYLDAEQVMDDNL